MIEQWLPIQGWEGYEVSNLGNVRSYKKQGQNGLVTTNVQRILKMQKNLNGYMQVTLKDKGRLKIVYVHRLVAEAFIPKDDKSLLVNHKNGIKTDNRIDNLEWCTSSENIQHAYKIGLESSDCNKKKVRQIDLITGKILNTFNSVQEASAFISGGKKLYHSNIGKVCNGVKSYKSAYGYKWEWC